ncbi:hypothetical protein OUZ56_000552 [Daphnia magna]|uniref:Uncharacterized protein n=1 Tax=Daphnia magna TaxID=35525 RepID=A0ABR0A016_9CRUS|nr:hypothetical protein OUZ56_000552 [Daphnia magna]
MVAVRRTTFVRFVIVAALLIAIGCIVSLIVIGTSKPPETDLTSSERKDCSTMEKKLPEAPTRYNPNHPGNDPDPRFESEMKESNIYNPTVVKPQGKMFPLNDMFGNISDEDLESLLLSHEQKPSLEKEMIHTLSSIVSGVSNPNIKRTHKANVKTKKNLEFKAEMTKLLTSIVQETNPTKKWSLAEILSSIVLEQGIDLEVKDMMRRVVVNIVNQHEADPVVKWKMVELVSDLISQESDEALKWKMLYTLWKISSQNMETKFKSQMLTILSAIAREENSPETQLKTATTLSSIIHRFGKEETRENMERLLSIIVHSSENFESTTADTAESEVDKQSELETVFPKKSTSVDAKLTFLNILSNLAQEETKRKVAAILIELISLTESQSPRIKAAMDRVLTKIITNNLITTDMQSEMVSNLSNILDEKKAPAEDQARKSEMTDLLSHVTSEVKASIAESGMKSEMINVVSRFGDEEKAAVSKPEKVYLPTQVAGKGDQLAADFRQQTEMVNMFTKVLDEEKAPAEDLARKSEMTDLFSHVTSDVKASIAESKIKSEMIKILSQYVELKANGGLDHRKLFQLNFTLKLSPKRSPSSANYRTVDAKTQVH